MSARVLIVAPSMDMVGGQSVQANLIAQGLRQSPSVAVSFQAINPRFPGLLQWLQDIKYVRTLTSFPLYCVQLLWSAAQCDVLHIFSASYMSFMLAPAPAILVGRLLGKRVLVNYHSGEAADHLRRWPSAVRVLRLAHQIVVPSAYLVRVLREFGLEATAICNAVDLTAFRYRLRPVARATFLANRNFEAHYNVGGVLQAFSLIQREVPNAELTVAGDGPQRAQLIRTAQDLGLRNVSFVGRTAPDAMPALYDAHDIWLNASTIDNMPLSVLEAFASGVAVVSSAAGGIPDVVAHERSGLLSACNDAQALAENALRVLRTPDLFRSMTATGFSQCAQYSWSSVEPQWIAAYEGLLRGGGTAT